MDTEKKISVLLETIIDDETHKVSLRVNFLLSDSNTQAAITKDTIIGLLEQRGFSQYQRLDEQISAAIEDIKQKLADLKSSSEPANETFETPVVAIAVDAKAEVKIAADSLEGFITITPAKGGKQLKLAEVKSVLFENGVKFGIEDQLLVDLLQQAQQSKTAEPIGKRVARAKQAVDGDDTQFIPLVDTANERALKPQLRPDGTIDLRALGNLPMVNAGHKSCAESFSQWVNREWMFEGILLKLILAKILILLRRLVAALTRKTPWNYWQKLMASPTLFLMV